MTTHKKQNIFVFLLLCCITFILWMPTLKLGFFSDDYHFLYVTSLQDNVWNYFVTNNVGEATGGSYGPIFNILFTLQYYVFHTWAFGFHVVTLLVYVLTAYMIYRFVYEIVGKKLIGFVSAFLFITLHNHVEAVSWVAVQPHIWATFFFVLGIYAYYIFVLKHSRIAYGVSLLSLGLSLFTKETAIMFPLVLCLMELFFSKYEILLKRIYHICIRLIPYGIVGLSFLYLRYRIVGYVFGYYSGGQIEGTDFFSYMIMRAKMFVEITTNMFVSSPYRQVVALWFGDHKVVLAIICVGILIMTHMVHRMYRKQLWFLLLSYICMSVPFLSLTYNSAHNGGERYAYVLSIFFVMYMTLLLKAITQDRRAGNIIYGAGIVILVCSSLAFLPQKLNAWNQSADVRDRIFDQITSHGYENTEIVDYFVFAGLPDNVLGAECMRNAVKEALYFETPFGYISGERIPMYTIPHGIQDVAYITYKKEDTIYVLSPLNLYNGRIFTGFRTYTSDVVSQAYLGNFWVVDNSGESISVAFDAEDIQMYRDRGYYLTLVYFDGKDVQFVPVKE
ncbi:MAG: hypothetical protein A2479_03870 [Candidatus Magasanikbacteria bacterium RIFOXYC2_FULL_39_8]|nr:MAG: hypothetical protein A2479_03870 [Candidatus Magasanikbacteria bacterium RIFOXYC2_FULL_39_8]